MKSLEKEEYKKMYEVEKDHWWFKSKRKLISEIIGNIRKDSVILDIGCGTGYNFVYFKHLSDSMIGIDISKEALLFSKKYSKNIALANSETIPFKDKSMDIVMALDLIEHVENDDSVVSEARRILKNNGTFILTVPAFNFLWSKHDEVFNHKRRYNKRQIEDLLARNGFKIEKITYWNFLLFPATLLYKFFSKNSNIKKTNKITNTILSSILSFDNFLVRYMNLPYGISLVSVARKT